MEMVDIGDGGKDPENGVSTSTEENSGRSMPEGKKNTGKIAKLTRGQVLEILAQAVLNCQQSGINARVASFYEDGQQSVVIILTNVELITGNLVPARK
jgi:hypothetical protein